MREPQAPVVIRLSRAQRAQIRKALGKEVSTLRIEPSASGSHWLYTCAQGREAWLLKRPDPHGYREAKRRQRAKIDPRFARFRMTVGRSRIHAIGVFAAERIPARRFVIEYTGERVNAVEAYRRIKDRKRTYVFALNKFWSIDAVVGGSGAEFINHSCDANLKSRVVAGHVLYHSVRPIEVGEELTVDYRFSWAAPRVPCRCGSPRCRGTINLKK